MLFIRLFLESADVYSFIVLVNFACNIMLMACLIFQFDLVNRQKSVQNISCFRKLNVSSFILSEITQSKYFGHNYNYGWHHAKSVQSVRLLLLWKAGN